MSRHIIHFGNVTFDEIKTRQRKIDYLLFTCKNYISHNEIINHWELRIEFFFSDFKKDVGETKSKKPSTSGGLGSLTSSSKPVKKPQKPKIPVSKPKSSIDSLFDSFEKGTFEPNKTEKKEETKTIVQPKSLMSSIFENVKTKNVTSTEKSENNTAEDDESKMKITKVFDFAGEAVE